MFTVRTNREPKEKSPNECRNHDARTRKACRQLDAGQATSAAAVLRFLGSWGRRQRTKNPPYKFCTSGTAVKSIRNVRNHVVMGP